MTIARLWMVHRLRGLSVIREVSLQGRSYHLVARYGSCRLTRNPSVAYQLATGDPSGEAAPSLDFSQVIACTSQASGLGDILYGRWIIS